MPSFSLFFSSSFLFLFYRKDWQAGSRRHSLPSSLSLAQTCSSPNNRVKNDSQQFAMQTFIALSIFNNIYKKIVFSNNQETNVKGRMVHIIDSSRDFYFIQMKNIRSTICLIDFGFYYKRKYHCNYNKHHKNCNQIGKSHQYQILYKWTTNLNFNLILTQ